MPDRSYMEPIRSLMPSLTDLRKSDGAEMVLHAER